MDKWHLTENQIEKLKDSGALLQALMAGKTGAEILGLSDGLME